MSEQLTAELGAERVFRDVDSVPLGATLREFLAAHVADCAVVIALIGEKWLPKLEERRSREEVDHVALELEVALEFKTAIIPVLVDGAGMPAESRLPEPLRGLSNIAALQLNAAGRDEGFVRLMGGIHHILRLVNEQRPGTDAKVEMNQDGRPKLVARGNIFDSPSITVNQAPLRAAFRKKPRRSR